MGQGRRAGYQARGTLNSTGFDNTYQALGVPLPHSACIVKIVNDSAVNIDISTDGVTDHDIVPANGYLVYDLRTNHGDFIDFALQAGTQFTAKGAAPSTGLVYLVTWKEV